MSKPKAFVKPNKTKNQKRAQAILESADDYLAAGVDYEEAAGKWRAGDAVKSMRFFNRAIETYIEGLRHYPQTFDLAYNKARVQYEIASHPLLVRHLHLPLLESLETALASHRYAISLAQDNADTLFNTSQVLTSIADELTNDDLQSSTRALQLLEEALELQTRCLNIQELKYEESEQQAREAMEFVNSDHFQIDLQDEPEQQFRSPSEASPEERWATIVDPVTRDTLIDTALAQLETLTTFCRIVSSSSDAAPASTLSWIEEFSAKLLQKKLPEYVGDKSDKLHEIALTKANFVSALLDAGYRFGSIDESTYKRERDTVFHVQELNLDQSIPALVSNASSLITFSSSMADSNRLNDTPSNSSLQWNALTSAIASLGKAAKIADISSEHLSRTHLLRGDSSLLQYQLSLPPISYPQAASNAPQLLKNAEVFYRNAARLSPDRAEQQIAKLRESVAVGLQADDVEKSVLSSFQNGDQNWIQARLEDMFDEGLLSRPMLSQ